MQATITYGPRGVAGLWSDPPGPTPDPLALLVGKSCAKLLAYLQNPRTTIQAAAELGLSSAAVSEQITKLWRAGLVDRTRVGRLVFYGLNERGKAVADAFHS